MEKPLDSDVTKVHLLGIALMDWSNNRASYPRKGRYTCNVCGYDEWCGTDGCPLDPQ